MITFDNFYHNSIGTWKGCKKPNRKPDYISYNRDGKISSIYWYGENKNGRFVIRMSAHWTSYKQNKTIEKGCTSVASCYWRLRTNSQKIGMGNWQSGKIFLSELRKIQIYPYVPNERGIPDYTNPPINRIIFYKNVKRLLWY